MNCCFIGHRDFNPTNADYEFLNELLINLIENKKVVSFIFGSRSNFNYFCSQCVSKLQKKYDFIKMIAYNCKHERSVLKSEKAEFELIKKFAKSYCSIELQPIYYDERFYSEEFNAGRNSYIKRNERMVKDSDFVIMYYDHHSVNTGTKNIFDFALKRHKKIYNLYELKK